MNWELGTGNSLGPCLVTSSATSKAHQESRRVGAPGLQGEAAFKLESSNFKLVFPPHFPVPGRVSNWTCTTAEIRIWPGAKVWLEASLEGSLEPPAMEMLFCMA